MGGRKSFTEQRFFWDRVHKTETCWNWIGYKMTGGYGQLSERGVKLPAHVWVYRKFKGAIPDGMTVDHICNNSSCVNPDHLQVLTQLDNNLRNPVFGANKTHCPKGHPYDDNNTYQRPNKKGMRQWRDCRECNRIASNKYYHSKRKLQTA